MIDSALKQEPETLYLIPGLLCNHRLWAAQCQALASRVDLRVVDTTVCTQLDELVSLILDAAPQRFALAGLSMGGYVCFEIMRRARKRISRLALLDTSPNPDSPDRIETRLQLMRLTEAGRFEAVIEAMLPALVHPDRLKDSALCDTIRIMAREVGPEGFLTQQGLIMGRPGSFAELAEYRLPTLVLCGRQDILTPPRVHENMAARLPQSELRVIERCGHLSPLEQPGSVTTALRRWLL